MKVSVVYFIVTRPEDARLTNGVRTADHVFEAQTFARFVAWLGDGNKAKLGKTYTKPDSKWVADVLLDEDKAFKVIKTGNTRAGDLNTPPSGKIPVVLLADGLGRSDGVKSYSATEEKNIYQIPVAGGNKNLALLGKETNGNKGHYFKKTAPGPTWTKTDQDKARTDVRRVS